MRGFDLFTAIVKQGVGNGVLFKRCLAFLDIATACLSIDINQRRQVKVGQCPIVIVVGLLRYCSVVAIKMATKVKF